MTAAHSMALLSHHLHTVVRAAKISGAVQMVAFGALCAFLLTVAAEPRGQTGSIRPEPFFAWVALLTALYIVPGIVLWVLAGRLEAGRVWVFPLICLLTVLDLAKLFFASLSGAICLNLFLRLPTLYLAACCLNAWPDVRDVYRERRRARRPRGFEPIIKSRPPVPTPPRPARLPPTRRSGPVRGAEGSDVD